MSTHSMTPQSALKLFKIYTPVFCTLILVHSCLQLGKPGKKLKNKRAIILNVKSLTGCITVCVRNLLCRFYPIVFHIEHLKSFEQDVFCRIGHSRRERGLQGPRRQAAQVLDGQLQSKTRLLISKQTKLAFILR